MDYSDYFELELDTTDSDYDEPEIMQSVMVAHLDFEY